jgi:hypothetical protein
VTIAEVAGFQSVALGQPAGRGRFSREAVARSAPPKP